MKNKYINILFTFNDEYTAKVGTCIFSICKNCSNSNKLQFHCITTPLKEFNKTKLSDLCRAYNCSICFYEIKEISNYFSEKVSTHGWHPIVLARLLLDRFLPKDIEKLIYLDGDTLVINDISKLYDIDLKGNMLGMSAEPTIDLKRIKKFNLGNHLYCNAGVLLIDRKQWANNNTELKIIDYCNKNHKDLFANDQDAINALLKDKILLIPPKFNYCNLYYQYPYWFFKNRLKPITYFDKNTYLESQNNPVILHFLGEDRPWRKHNTHKYSKLYKEYQSQTIWKNEPDEDGWKTYYLFYKIFNTVMYPFPHLHLFIINKLIPLFKFYSKRQLKKNN